MIETKCTAYNGRFGASGQWLVRKVVRIFKFCASYQMQWNPRLREAAGTLYASGGQRSGTLKAKN